MFYSRGKNKIQNPYCEVEMYKDYIKDKDEESPYYISKQEYKDICASFYKVRMELLREQGGVFKMPYRIGELEIVKKKIDITNKKTLPLDWPETQKLGKHVYLLNEHSRGFRYSFHWNKKAFALKNKYLYRLVITRTNTRKLAKMIKSGEYDYFEL